MARDVVTVAVNWHGTFRRLRGTRLGGTEHYDDFTLG
jgi:hypothetical protein